jgi:hypothetical protein
MLRLQNKACLRDWLINAKSHAFADAIMMKPIRVSGDV